VCVGGGAGRGQRPNVADECALWVINKQADRGIRIYDVGDGTLDRFMFIHYAGCSNVQKRTA